MENVSAMEANRRPCVQNQPARGWVAMILHLLELKLRREVTIDGWVVGLDADQPGTRRKATTKRSARLSRRPGMAFEARRGAFSSVPAQGRYEFRP